MSAKLGLARTIKSAILNENRKVLVHLPASYDTSGKSYSALYLLAKPTVFNAYVACSAGWFAENNEYFRSMSNRAFQKAESFANRRVFMATLPPLNGARWRYN